MREAIGKHLRDFIAVAALFVIALATSYYIVQEQRLRIPVLEERPFEMKAEFETAQAVVPGQGQTIRVAGVRVGDVQKVDIEEGVGVVTFAIDRKFLPVYKDATILMRPTTGLKDMFFELDPGSRAAGEVDEGGTLAVENTAPDVNLDEVLEILDTDTQAYLRLLFVGAGQGLKGNDKKLGKVLGSLGPINNSLDRLNSEVAKRRVNLANLIHNLNILTDTIGDHDGDVNDLILASNDALGTIASQEPDNDRTAALLDDALVETEEALIQVRSFAGQLGPTLQHLRPFARNLDEINDSVLDLGTRGTPALRDGVRPFVRAARPVTPLLRETADVYIDASPNLTRLGEGLNTLANMAAYNPRGAEPPNTVGRDEGYLYWAGWLGHVGNLTFNSQDAHGIYRRIYYTASCANITSLLQVNNNPSLTALVTGLGPLVANGGPCNPGP